MDLLAPIPYYDDKKPEFVFDEGGPIVIGTLKAHIILVYPSLLKTSLWRKSILVPLR